MSVPGIWTRLMRLLDLDFHVAATLLFRSWSIVAGGVMVILIPTVLSGVQQGYYFTFSSLLALQVFFELGINQVIVQLVSHEMAHLRRGGDGTLEGDPAHIARLGSLVRMLHRWYVFAAVLFAIAVGVAGSVFFLHSGELEVRQWFAVWLALVVFTAVNLYFSPTLATLEGAGQIGQVSRLRLVQSMTGYILLWLALLFGAKLSAVLLLPATSACLTAWWVREKAPLVHWLKHRAPADPVHRVNWRTEVLPFQWRIAISWASGYFIFQLFTPLIFANQGALEAGRFGLTMSIFSAVLTVGMSWVNAKSPHLTAHIARSEHHMLNGLFVAVSMRSIGFVGLACLLVVLMAWVLQPMGFPFLLRLASLPALACLAAVTVTNSFVFAAAIYMRAHREEPMLKVSIAAGFLTLASAYFASKHSVVATVGVYALITVGMVLPWTTWLFVGYYRKHARAYL
jgi:hypothetical protein